MEKARVFLADAERHLEEGHYWLTCFSAQQAAELYLKGFITALTGIHPFTHDIVELLESLKSLGLDPDRALHICGCANSSLHHGEVSW